MRISMRLLAALSSITSLFSSSPMVWGPRVIETVSYQGLTKGNRCAPGANAAFRRAAAKARRIRRG